MTDFLYAIALLRAARIFLALMPLVPLAWLRAHRERTLARAFSGVPSAPTPTSGASAGCLAAGTSPRWRSRSS